MAIYQAAMSIVTAEGLAGASMSKIARRAGVSPSTIYVYFENKSDMLNKLYLVAKGESGSAVFENLRPDMDIKEALSTFVRGTFKYMVAHPVVFSFHEQYCNDPRIPDDVREEGLRFYEPLYGLYYRALDAGLVAELPIPLAAAFVVPPIMQLVKDHMAGLIQVDDMLLDRVVEMVWGALTA